MNEEKIKDLLKKVHEKKATPEEAFDQLKNLPYENLDFAKIDHHRSIRTGMPEVVYCEGKTSDQLIEIINKITVSGSNVLATRLSKNIYEVIKNKLHIDANYNEISRTLTYSIHAPEPTKGLINIVTAGTSDIPVAEEAAVTAGILGSKVEKIFDVGVAGIHRLFDKLNDLRSSRVIIIVAGMDGALASVIGGLVNQPIIAVPTSVGYGAAFNGLAPLLTMLNSCSAGIATVNIDNGFGAGCIAHKINLLGE
ncbi:MAG: nickel pincer cofactor biosynthesis protein LarB [Nitrospinales bacterium]